MGITLFTFAGLFAPLQRLVDWLARPPANDRFSSRAPSAAQQPAPAQKMKGAAAGRPLRVVRVLETSPAPRAAGRMVISGRMADVCAELERLAALEAAVS